MKLGGIHHVSIDVRRLDEAAKFYREALGLEEIARPDLGFPGLWLRAGAQEIHLMQVEQGAAPASQHFALRVDDLDEALSELEARGVRVSPPRAIPSGGRQAFLRDPSGNLIELHQPRDRNGAP